MRRSSLWIALSTCNFSHDSHPLARRWESSSSKAEWLVCSYNSSMRNALLTENSSEIYPGSILSTMSTQIWVCLLLSTRNRATNSKICLRERDWRLCKKASLSISTSMRQFPIASEGIVLQEFRPKVPLTVHINWMTSRGTKDLFSKRETCSSLSPSSSRLYSTTRGRTEATSSWPWLMLTTHGLTRMTTTSSFRSSRLGWTRMTSRKSSPTWPCWHNFY